MTKDEKQLTILGHLAELRIRVIRSVIFVTITTTLSFIFWHQILGILVRPAPGISLVFIEVTEMIGVVFRVCLISGIILAMPYLVFQLLMFVSPALTRKEKKYVYLVLPWVTGMFLGGVAFTYFVLLPPAMKFLLNFGSDFAVPQIRIGNYISVITRLMLTVGVVFELPVVTTFLARLGILSPDWLAGKRKWAIVLAFIVGALITPTLDPVNQSLVSVPLIVLYEMSIWLAKLVYKKERSVAEVSAVPA
jgi:sec-independent protein translocase protein TatC